MLRACKDSVTGESVVQSIECGTAADPRELGETEADLIIEWRGAPQGLTHPEFGQIGPIPYRRTGGHTGGYGFAFVRSRGVMPGEQGLHSAHDVVPTLIDLLGEGRCAAVSGVSVLDRS
jgi:hypothetical protein